MCEFVSWINHKGTNYYLKDKDLRGKKFNEFKKYNCNWRDDISGHGTIRFVYPELDGKGSDKECTDFSSPDNFPAEIAASIKNMEMTKFGVAVGSLTSAKRAEYQKIKLATFRSLFRDPKNRIKAWR